MLEKLYQAVESPRELEALYRGNPSDFIRLFPDVLSKFPDSIILGVWKERLNDELGTKGRSENADWSWRDIRLVILLVIVAGTLAQLPEYLNLDDDFFYSRFLGTIILAPLAIYFLVQQKCDIRISALVVGLFAISPLYLANLTAPKHSEALTIACLHSQVLNWSLLGVAFLSVRWADSKARLDFIRYNGELLVYTVIILLGGMVLTGVTYGLFSLIGVKIENVMQHVIVYGAVASPIVATLIITRISGRRIKIASLLSRIFAPLFFVMILLYLIAMIVVKKSPYSDREFLMSFNILLLVVLGLAVFAVTGRSGEEKNASDYINFGLLIITLAIDLVALSAILFRLSSYGFSENRIVVLGANLAIFGHLAGLLFNYFRYLRARVPFFALESWVGAYLPVYTVWTAIVAFGFPVIFGMK